MNLKVVKQVMRISTEIALDDKYFKMIPHLFGLEDCESGHSYGPAIRPHWLVHFVLSGKGTYVANGTTYEILPGQAFVIRPDEITLYAADKADPWFYIWIGFVTDSLHDVPYVIDDPDLGNIFLRFSESFKTGHIEQTLAIAYIWEIFGFFRKYSVEASDNSYIQRAINIIEKQYSKDLSVASIADQLAIDRSYFSNLFRNQLGITPKQYILTYRMGKALTLLKRDKYSVAVVAASVGYNDPFSFSRSFKNFYGVPPQKYKEIRMHSLPTLPTYNK